MRDRTTEEEWKEVAITNKVCLAMADLFDSTQRMLLRRGTRDALNALIAHGGPGLGKHFTIRAAVRAAQRRRLKSPINLPNRPLKAAEISRVCGSAKYPVIYTHANPNGGAAWTAIIEALLAANEGSEGYYRRAPLLVSTPLDVVDLKQFPAGARKAVKCIDEVCGQISFTSNVLERLEYTCWLAIMKGLLRTDSHGRVHSVEAQNHALDWFTQHVWRLGEVSPRTLLEVMRAIGATYAGGGADLSELDKLLTEDGRGTPPLSPRLLQAPRSRPGPARPAPTTPAPPTPEAGGPPLKDPLSDPILNALAAQGVKRRRLLSERPKSLDEGIAALAAKAKSRPSRSRK